jgi:hypothetical protein
MTGFPDDGFGGHGDFRGNGDFGPGPDGEHPDPIGRLLRPPGEFLPAPPGSFERIRRRAARRRRTRALAGGTVVAAMITGSVYLVGALSPHDSGDVVGPPATSSQVTHSPAPSLPPVTTPVPSTGGRTQTATPSPTVTPGTGPPAGPSGAPSTGTTPPSQTPTPQCTAGQLTAALGGGDAAAGNLYRYLVLTNHSDTACHLTGFPGVSLLDAHGQQIGAPATRDPISYQPVELAPGDSASDTIHTANQQGSCLPTSASVRVYPPGSRASLVVPGEITACDGVLTISPLGKGRTGNPAN